MDIRETKYKNTVEYVMSCINCTVRHIYCKTDLMKKNEMGRVLGRMGEMSIASAVLYTKPLREHT